MTSGFFWQTCVDGMSLPLIIKCLEKVSQRKREECGHLKEESRLEMQKEG